MTYGPKAQARTVYRLSETHAVVFQKLAGSPELRLIENVRTSDDRLVKDAEVSILLSPEQAMELGQALIEEARQFLQKGGTFSTSEHWNNERVLGWQEQNRQDGED